ncbi:sulfite exporter TauE/SafE family protein [Peribacillus cavernae]|uniref:Probable membrane transporter protein n=1 Tax=Peribacillus cavernae TaxID=1674310 RepID=A0A3S1B4Z1_9BACI|nr:sulfite exporter TauE/SafE family protein [Peribacillus cavernae]MDQ0219112.1 putative membrane protein YfcA [Peribacillus cavernae]RUQ28655.1 sulfite exporter TauE/SafE family protein [Peribacillus cavernae]
MKKLLVLSFVGFLAQLIDGSLGMAYGVTSSSLLLAFGIAPAVASASVHLSEVVTTAASGISHIRFGNVDRKMVFRLIIPGSVGAFAGACFLSNLPGNLVKPYVSTFLLILGVYIIIRFLFLFRPTEEKESPPLPYKQSIPLGLIAGFADATGGGGWGPIATPILLSKKGMTARKVIGTVDTTEFAVALSATAGFILSLGWDTVNWLWVGALMLGGVFAAPIAAWLVRIIPAQLMGVFVGGFIIIVNARTLVTSWLPNSAEHYPTIYTLILLLWAIALFFSVKKQININKNNLVNGSATKSDNRAI